ncbi:MAG TPA: hypothetical protein VF070_02155, partial [Streptosporangiaceae bacterium]
TRAGLGHLPLVITEHGWPTGPGRTPERQAEVLRTVVGVISRYAEPLNIDAYVHHALRDERSGGSGLFCEFGLMTDDYSPKPAFRAYRDLIAGLGRSRRWSARSEARTNDLDAGQDDGHTRPRGRPRKNPT